MSDSNVQGCAIRFIEDASYWIAALRERELHGIAAAMENLANERDALRAAQLHNRLVIAQHEEHLGRIQDELSESRRLLESSEAALQEAQRALFRWLPNRIGSEYDDLIAADAMTLMGLESVDGLREIGGEILIELVEKRRLLDEANADRDRLYKALEYVVRDLTTRANMKLRKEDRGVVDIGNGAWFQANDALEKHKAAPVPAQPAAPDFIPALYSWLARAHFDRQQDEVTASRFGQQLHAWITAQPAVCDDCGALCTPANNAKSHIKRCAACQSAFVASLDSAITAQSAAAPEAVAKDAIPAGWVFYSADASIQSSDPLRPMAAMIKRDVDGVQWWLQLTEEEKERTSLYSTGVGMTLTLAIQNAVDAILSAADTEVKKDA